MRWSGFHTSVWIAVAMFAFVSAACTTKHDRPAEAPPPTTGSAMPACPAAAFHEFVVAPPDAEVIPWGESGRELVYEVSSNGAIRHTLVDVDTTSVRQLAHGEADEEQRRSLGGTLGYTKLVGRRVLHISEKEGEPATLGRVFPLDGGEPFAIDVRGFPSKASVVEVVGESLLVWPRGDDEYEIDFSRGFRVDLAEKRSGPISAAGAPSPRSDYALVISGRHVVVWSGSTDRKTVLADGAIYDADADRWTPIASEGAPAASWNPWGGEMPDGFFVFSGRLAPLTDVPEVHVGGGIYRFSTRTWTAISTDGSPSQEDLLAVRTTFWTGRRFLFFGARARQFDPAMNRWFALPAPPFDDIPAALADGRVFLQSYDGSAYLVSPERNLTCRLSRKGVSFFEARPGYFLKYWEPHAVGNDLVFYGRTETEICTAGYACRFQNPKEVQYHDGVVVVVPRWP